jgi:hypothetical protein
LAGAGCEVIHFMDLWNQFRQYAVRPHVRPWALAAPIVVLLVCLPLLRPLRHPDPRDISDDELARLATIQSLVEQRTLAIDEASFKPTSGTIRRNDHIYSAQPPTQAVLLAGPYWVMHRFGLTFEKKAALVAYVLTMLGVTIPVALGAGLIYRMARTFELKRPVRGMMAVGVALASGMVSYAVVLNAHGPAAALLLGAAALVIHVAIAKKPRATSGWLAIAGMCAALAAVIDPPAALFAILFAAAILAMRWRFSMKLGGLFMYVLGMTPPLLLHALLTIPLTGDILPPQVHQEIAAAHLAISPSVISPDDADDSAVARGIWNSLGRGLARIGIALLGAHGIFSHFPIIILGLFGVAAVMHRHWPSTTKTLALATLAGAAAIILTRALVTRSGAGAMFGPQAFVLFLPLVLFWSGAWLRRHHGPVKWTMVATLLLFSIAVGLIGATDPCPRGGYDRYTVAQAIQNLIRGDAMDKTQILAGR